AAGRIEIERERAREIGLGVVELFLRWAFILHAAPFRADDVDRLCDMRVLGGDRAEDEAGMAERIEAARDAIGEAALLPHLGGETRREAAAAQDMVDDIGGVPIGIVALDAGLSEDDDALRDRQLREQHRLL